MDYYLEEFLFSLLMISRCRGDRAYEISFLKVYPPISLVGLGASLPRPNTPKRLNVRTLIATLGIGISLFTDLTEGCSIQIPGGPYLSILDI